MNDFEVIADILDIAIINEDVRFWFVRTNGGELFHKYQVGNYIAIGWDKLGDLKQIREMNRDQLKEQVISKYSENGRPGYVANQVLTFVNEIKKDDYVIIPSKDSEIFLFGKITSEVYEHNIEESEKYINHKVDESDYEYLKRHDVKWLGHRMRKSLDPYLYRIIYSHNTIVQSDEYASNILSTLYDSYIYKENYYSVIRITTEDEIPGITLTNLLKDSIDYIEEVSGYEVTEDNLSIKLNLNSPGIIEFMTAFPHLAFGIGILGVAVAGGHVKIKCAKAKLEGELETPGLAEAIVKIGESKATRKMLKLDQKLEHHKEKLQIEQNTRKKNQ